MTQPLIGVGMAMILSLVAPELQTERPDGAVHATQPAGDATELSDSWILLAGCPEACPPSAASAPRRLDSADVALDGNAWVMALNLAEDGLQATRDAVPTFDPGPGQDLVWALNRAGDGLHDRVEQSAPGPAMHATLKPALQRPRSALDALVASEVPAVQRLVSWAWESYEGAIFQLQRRWYRTTRALGIALLESWVAISTTATDAGAFDPELQAPLDRSSAAWVESVRSAESEKALVREIARTGHSNVLRLASEHSEDSLEQSTPAIDSATPSGVEIGCGAIGLPKPIDAPHRDRSIGY